MAKTEQEHRQDIIDIGRLVYQKGWVAANDGNITLRLDAERILATPTGVSKGMMHVDDLIVLDMQGKKLSGRKEGTSEIAMHMKIYEMRPDVRSVLHAHPPVATGFATAGRPLNLALLPEVIIGLGLRSAGRIRTAGHAGPHRTADTLHPQVRRDYDG